MTGPADEERSAGFGTFSGVFRPTTLTILGAMLYLREGWLVGNGGLLGAIAVLVLSLVITGTTALSAASIATNHRVRPGGAFAIIGQALGLEAGGAIGVPLFIAQALSGAMYLYAFREGWGYLFPSHPTLPVVVLAFVGVSVVTWISAAFAFRAQAVMFFVVIAAVVSAAAGIFGEPLHSPQWVGSYSEASFLQSFAIFFPAATGIMVGIGMSGQLDSPRRSIPRGTLSAWAVTGAVYLGFAVWFSLVAEPAELRDNKLVMVDRAAVPVLVLVGLVTSTLTAAISSLVAAPRLLQAMAEVDVVPGSRFLSTLSAEGEPRRATLVTLGIAAIGLLSGSLDAIAPIITAFFVLTFLALNLVVVIEQRLGMISFRPTFAVPDWIPALGVAVCGLCLFLASPRPLLILGLLSVVGLYVMLARRSLDTPWETVRSGVAVALATWAARRASTQERSERAWKPDLLVPIRHLDEAERLEPLLHAMTVRNGSIKLLGVGEDELRAEIGARTRTLRTRGVHASSTVLDAGEFAPAVRTAIDAMQGDLFPPNLVLLDLSRCSSGDIRAIRGRCRELRLGLVLFHPHPDGGLGPRRGLDVWLSDRHPDWRLRLHVANVDLPVLVGYLLATCWKVPLRLVTVVREPDAVVPARAFLAGLAEAGRLPDRTAIEVRTGSFRERLTEGAADVCLFGIGPQAERDALVGIARASGAACLFLMDSGQESALA